jgi:nucleoside phosphorylase
MPNLSDCTVSWICSTYADFAAIGDYMVEFSGDSGDVFSLDTCYYTIGKVGRHNVVSVFPNALSMDSAIFASDMLRNFPNIRLSLFVGVGGGVPSEKHDIRLGDVVVGTSGVVQYDSGENIQGFQPTGPLDIPPPAVLKAVESTRERYKVKGNQIEEVINRIFKGLNLQMGGMPLLKRPEPGVDKLFKTQVTHDSVCQERSCSDDPLSLITRPKRKHEDNPTIHCGLIASVGELKNASIRDRFSEEMDVLCFITEAAGMMNHLPCLAIRGICSYSDSHVYDSHAYGEWKRYASMTAMAFAKDLLQAFPQAYQRS